MSLDPASAPLVWDELLLGDAAKYDPRIRQFMMSRIIAAFTRASGKDPFSRLHPSYQSKITAMTQNAAQSYNGGLGDQSDGSNRGVGLPIRTPIQPPNGSMLNPIATPKPPAYNLPQ
jgi:hypothetical protein